MSIPVNPPAMWSDNQLIAPEKLNRNLFAAKNELESWAEQQWHRFSLSTGKRVNDNLCVLPLFVSGFTYYIERIVVYGDYTGSPVLTWGVVGQPVDGSYTFPTDGYATQQTVLPGVLRVGSLNSFNYEIKLTGAGGDECRAIVVLRCSRVPGSSPVFTSLLSSWEEGDSLDPTKFNSQLTALNNFTNTWSSTASLKPNGMHYVEFRDFTTLTSAASLTDRLLGSGGELVKQIGMKVTMTTPGLTGQTVTLNAGYGSTSVIGSVSVAGLSSADFFSGVINLTDAVRVPSVAGDDFLLNVSTNNTSEVARVQLFILKSKP